MEYTAEVCSSFCSLEKFIVNGIEAIESDFVVKNDEGGYRDCDCHCGDMQAHVTIPYSDILGKYNITVEEFNVIAEDIAGKLSFGACGLCD